MIHTGAMKRTLSPLLICLFLSLPVAAFANKADDLKRIEADLKQQQSLEKDYAEKQKDIEDKLQLLRKDLKAMTADIQVRERALLKVQKGVIRTQKEIEAQQQILDKQRASLAHVILALQRISRMPPQMLIVRPAKPIETARSFEILQNVIPAVSTQAAAIKETLEKMSELHETLLAQEEDLKAEQAQMKKRQDKLEATVAERQRLLKETQASQKQAAEKTAALSHQAKDLRDLLARLSAAVPKPVAKPTKARDLIQSLSSWLGVGKSQLPVTGNIKTSYGQSLAGGGTSQGLTIEASPSAIVVAPGGGIIRFAGPFRQYKLLVIIQHTNGEHSLLGGLQEIYTRVGDTVEAGEPIGKLGSGKQAGEKLAGDSQPLASLYYERRRQGKPIDPRNARG